MWLECQWDHIPPGVASNIYHTGKTLIDSRFITFYLIQNEEFSNFLYQICLCRLAGVALVVPVVNYRWPSLPDHLIKDDYRRKLIKWGLFFAEFAPGLLRWWVTQKWLPSTSVLERNPVFFNSRDIEVLKTIPGFPMLSQVTISSVSKSVRGMVVDTVIETETPSGKFHSMLYGSKKLLSMNNIFIY